MTQATKTSACFVMHVTLATTRTASDSLKRRKVAGCAVNAASATRADVHKPERIPTHDGNMKYDYMITVIERL